MLKKIQKAFSLYRTDPTLFRQKLITWFCAPKIKQSTTPHEFTQTFDEVKKELQNIKAARVVWYGDRVFYESCHAACPEYSGEWVSHHFKDLEQGAELLERVSPTAYEAIVVGGTDVKTGYINSLKTLEHQGRVVPVFWVGNGFEYVGSQIPIPAEVNDAHIYLFNHFSDFFLVKDPLLVKITVADITTRIERFELVLPRHTLKISLRELLPHKHGPAVVMVYSTHPMLTRNRHHRWRVIADLFWNKSIATVHGGHDWGPERLCHSRFMKEMIHVGRMVITLPNYWKDMTDPVVNVYNEDHISQYTRKKDHLIDQVVCEKRGPASIEFPFIGYSYRGYGTSFWYAFESNIGPDHRGGIFGNHEATIPFQENLIPQEKYDASTIQFLDSLESRQILLHPHALPVTGAEDVYEFGVSFWTANPRIHQFVIHAFDREGKYMSSRSIPHDHPGFLFTSDIIPQFGVDASSVGLFIVSPDCRGLQLHPLLTNVVGDLVVRHRVSGDKEVTEFQNCWRNLGFIVSELPHWLAPTNAVFARTNILARAVSGNGYRTGVVIANASGNRNYNTTAAYVVHVYNADGEERIYTALIGAFQYRAVWLDDVIPGLDNFLSGGFGTVVLTSPDADLNGQILTITSAGAISLQHMWGY